MPPYPEYERLAASPPGLRSTAATSLPVVEEGEATGEVAELYERFRREFGRPDVPGILHCFATHPPLLRSMMDLAQSLLFTDGHLTRRHKEMVATFISARNECPYCADSHGYFLRLHGGSEETLCALQENHLETPAISAAERLLLHFVDRVNTESRAISRADVDELRRAGWNTLQISEAVHLTALFAMFNRVANAFGLQSQGLLAQCENQPTQP
jgi:uncharacterized peroxidase-related enzyme